MESISQYSQNVRYQLAKQQFEQMFLKWISQDNVHSFVDKLIDEVHDPTNNILQPPTPLFINKIAAPLSPSAKTNGPDMDKAEFGRTPPRSPSGMAGGYRTVVKPIFDEIEENKNVDLTKTQKLDNDLGMLTK